MDQISSIALLLISIGFIAVLLLIVGVVILSFACSSLYERDYKKGIIKLLETINADMTDDRVIESIQNQYSYYRNRRINAASYKDIVTLTRDLVSEIRNGKHTKYHSANISSDIVNKLEVLVNKMKKKFLFEEDEIYDLAKQIKTVCNSSESEKLADKVLVRFATCIGYCNGRLFDKEQEIFGLKSKLSKKEMKTWLTIAGWVLGLISSIITITTIF